MGKNGFDDFDATKHPLYQPPVFSSTPPPALYAEIDRLKAALATDQKVIEWLASKLANRGDCPDAAGLFPHFPGCEDNAKCDDDDYCWETMARRRVEEGA